MFSFIMEMEGMDFRGALELLARKAGLDLSQYQTSRSAVTSTLKERLFSANTLAAKFYQAHFSKNQTALHYILKKRQLSKDTALAFQIGYAPGSGQALLTFLKKQGYSQQELQQAGLVTRWSRPNDMFRSRIMIPLADPQGRVIGFTARLLEDEPDSPKYLNTPQTVLYDKSRHVFGLNLAKEAIRQHKFAVVVEGNMDVIASYQAGVKQTVATAGTAITEMHLKSIGRFAPDVRLAFDQDSAGVAATERAIPLANKTGVNLSIIDIPGSKDPDELIRKDPKAWERTITKKQDAQDWLITQYEKRADLNTFAGRDLFKQAVLGSVKRLESAGEQGVYAKKVAQILGYSEEAIHDELKLIKQGRTTYRPRQAVEPKVDQSRLEIKKAQDHLLAICLLQPPLRYHLNQLTAEMLHDEDARSLLQFLQDNPDFNGDVNEASGLREIGDYVKILSLQYEELYQDLGLLELRNEATRLQIRLIEHYVKLKKHVLTQALLTADDDQTNRLLQQAKALDELLKNR